MKTLTQRAIEAHQAALDNGFYDNLPSVQRCKMLIICECAEMVEAHRKRRYAVGIDKEKEFDKEDFQDYFKDTVQDELADVAIRLYDLIGYLIRLNSVQTWPVINFKVRDQAEIPEGMYEVVLKLTTCQSGWDYAYVLGMVYGYAEAWKFDLEGHIELKMKYNETRSYKHGKAY